PRLRVVDPLLHLHELFLKSGELGLVELVRDLLDHRGRVYARAGCGARGIRSAIFASPPLRVLQRARACFRLTGSGAGFASDRRLGSDRIGLSKGRAPFSVPPDAAATSPGSSGPSGPLSADRPTPEGAPLRASMGNIRSVASRNPHPAIAM